MSDPALPLSLTFDEWVETYKPVENHINSNAGFDGIMFETYGPELDFVRAADPACVWTWICGDEDDEISSGYSHVNRMGYFVCEVPLPENVIFASVPFDDEE